jgi:hypothetical protein
MDAHFVLQARTVHRVACAQRAVGIDQVLGHHEQAHALDAHRRIGQAGQHQMDDVVGHVMLASANENFCAGDFVSAVGLGFGLGAHKP